MNWDDLRIVAAVRDEGTYAGASARLRIDETTVGRRLARIQRTLGLRLFEAVDGVRKPTRQCEMVLAHVQAMAAHVAEINKVGESLPGLTGRFRIASTNSVAEEILSPRASRLLTQNPGLAVQFLTSSGNVKFSRWAADLAIRLRKPDKGDFTISRLADIRLYFFEPAAGIDCRAGRLRLSRGSRFDSGVAVSEGEGAASSRALHHRQCPGDQDADPDPSGCRHPAGIHLWRLAGRPPPAGDAAAAAARCVAVGAEPPQARARRTRRDRLGSRLLPGIFEGVAVFSAERRWSRRSRISIGRNDG